ncbi:14 kDa phosphohistidine phosphatase-like [Anthonomus grandis grandis]|uniref:14 kDa phosphohistidine phosphatase-like n=1 Tax=Anthonomus grandis grandis TaxID=2921223 RepID=UPI0021653285|nr:14 kDa phosphohistidine phosphatase-like [Anthonomus grandis grandis]
MLRTAFVQIRKMASSAIPQVKNVDIDPRGTFKYILIKVSCPNDQGKFEDKLIVRGYAECGYHADINDKVTEELQALKAGSTIKDWRSKVLGGGRIKHDPDGKTLNVYGYSQGYGKADHQLSVDILKTQFPNYNITWSDEGY